MYAVTYMKGRPERFGIILAGATKVKIYRKKGRGSFTISNRTFSECYGR